MGDVAMTIPVLRAAKEAYPDLRIVMLTQKSYAPFFDGSNIDFHFIDLKGKHKGVSGIRKLYKEIRSQYDIDIVLDLQDKLYSMLLRRFFRWAGTPTFHIDKGRKGKKALTRPKNKVLKPLRSTINRYADVFAQAGYPVSPGERLIRQTREIPSTYGTKTGIWIGIAPFAKHQGKILPLNIIKELIALTLQNIPDSRIFIFGGGSQEKEIAENLQNEFGNLESTIGKTSLTGEMDLIANLDAMVSMDSSAMHMSSLVGTPVVSAWGATHPYAGFMGFGQSEANAVGIDLECRPCSVYGNKPCARGDYACLTGIQAGQILRKVAAVLKKAQS